MKYYASPEFWDCYHRLPICIQRLADKNFELLKQNPHHRSLQLKKIGRFWSARVGQHYRTLAVESGANLIWFWIGTHADYDRQLGS